MKETCIEFPVSDVSYDQIAEFCRRWQIVELVLFGSATRSDFGPESDVDVLVEFAERAEWGLLEHVQMQQELERLFQRDVDLITRRAIQQSANWLRRQEILNTAQVLYSLPEDAHATG